MKNTKSVLKQLIKEELEGLGPRKGAMSGLPGSTASQRRYSRRAGELEADRMTHGMDINPYQALADQAIAEIEDSVVNRGMARPALDKLIQAAESDPDAKAVLDAVQSETGLSIGRMSAVATMPRMAPQLSPAERDAATMQENYKPILGGSKMKITKSALKRLIKEELNNLEEQDIRQQGMERASSPSETDPIVRSAGEPKGYGRMNVDYKTVVYNELEAALQAVTRAGRAGAMIGSGADADPGRGRGDRAVAGMGAALSAAKKAIQEAIRLASMK